MFWRSVAVGEFYKCFEYHFVEFRNWKALQTKNVPRTKNAATEKCMDEPITKHFFFGHRKDKIMKKKEKKVIS